MISAGILAVGMFLLNYLLDTNAQHKVRLDFEDQYVKKVKTDYVRNVQIGN
jgi:hypothetical protein